MDTSPAMDERSILRSRLRDRATIMLASLSEAYPRQLASALRTSCYRLDSAMLGRPEDGYSQELALVTLGLVEVRSTSLGRVFVITAKGRRKARQLTARRARHAERRAAAREAASRVRPHPLRGAIPGAASPVPTTEPPRPPPVARPDTSSYRWAIEE